MIKKIIEYLFALGLVIGTNTVFSHNLSYNFPSKLFFLVTLLLLVSYIIFNKKIILRKKTLLHMFLYLGFLGIYCLFGGIDHGHEKDFILTFLLILPILLFFYSTVNKEFIYEILEKFVYIVLLLSFASIIVYLLGPVLNIIKPTDSLILTWEEYPKRIYTYYNLLFNIQKTSFFNINVIRNTGIFVEAPMYSAVLTVSYAINNFVLNKEKGFLINLILLLTTVTTFSTTGIVLFAIIYILKIKDKNPSNSFTKKLKDIAFIILLIIILFLSISVINDKVGSASYNIRMDDYMASMKAWLEKPLFGHGFGNKESIIKYMRGNRYEGTSNAIGIVLAQGGIWLTTLLLSAPLISTITYSNYSKKKELAYFAIVVTLLYICVSIPYSPIMLNFIAIGLSYMGNKEKVDGGCHK